MNKHTKEHESETYLKKDGSGWFCGICKKDVQTYWTVTEEEHKQGFHDCLDDILDKCVISEIDGEWLCKKCKQLVYVDWFEKTLTCEGCGDL